MSKRGIGRSRSTKNLAQRIDLNYFKRPYPIPRWRRDITFALLGIAAVWLTWILLAGKQAVFSAGALSPGHASLISNCAACHTTQSAFGRKATDAGCLACHNGPIHHVEQSFTPPCADCHVEHSGSLLSNVRSRACTQCHARLKGNVSSFQTHREFAALTTLDPSTIRMNHQVHTADNLRGPRGSVHLTCADCHARERGQMRPVEYAKHCASCHPLNMNPSIPETAPHAKPQVVADFVAKHSQGPRTPLSWKVCDQCHAMTTAPSSPIPEITPVRIPTRWFQHATFDHDAHQMAACTDCHARALTSTVSADILLPGIDTCRKCHGSSRNAAASNCSECHVYHDWTKQKKINSKLRVPKVP
jgi:hypothetical protein